MHYIGLADDDFCRLPGVPMTKREVRIQVLAKAQIKPDDTVIDIGAGTGSLSIEAALLAPDGIVFAIEKQSEAIKAIALNASKFLTTNLELIKGTAPAALSGLPTANVIFVGGSGGQLKDILNCCDQLLQPDGRLIVTAVTPATLTETLTYMDSSGYEVDACGLQVTRLNKLGAGYMFQSLNHIYVIAGKKA